MINAKTIAGMRAMRHDIIAEIGVMTYEFDLVTMADVLVILADCVNEFADEKRYEQEADGLDAHPVDCVCRLCRAEPLARAILGEENE